jgi:hypothetical protein
LDTNAFHSFLPIKIQDLTSLIMQRKQYEFREALHYLYSSLLYEALSNEETKLWHLSSEKLLDMLENEKLTHTLIYPDYV